MSPTNFDSFDQSTHGEFTQSPLGERNDEPFGDLVVGGEDFRVEDIASSRSIAVWDDDNDTWLKLADIAPSGAFDSGVHTMLSFGGKLYVGGNFAAIDGDTALKRVAIYDVATSAWSLMGQTDDIKNGTVTDMIVDGSNLFVRGTFLKAGGSKGSGALDYNPETNTFNDIYTEANINLGSAGGGSAIFNQKLYTTGSGTWNKGEAGSPPLGDVILGIAQWNGIKWIDVDGSIDSTSFGLGGFDCKVFNGQLYFCGQFTKIGSGPTLANMIARFDGDVWSNLGVGTNQTILNDIQPYKGDLIVSGQLSTAGGIAVNRIAGWTGSSWFKLGDNPVRTNAYGATPFKDRLISGGVGDVWEWTKSTSTWRKISDSTVATKELIFGDASAKVFVITHHKALIDSL